MTPTAAAQTAPHRVIRTLLVANRGEIARRVFRTARAMGIRTVAVHSDPDRDAPFVRDADVAVPLRGSTSAETYLDAGRVLAAAAAAGADAIHPGYGFLSENPDFARAVTDAGLVWVGPTPESIRAMALKVESKRLVAEAGVPLVPGAELAADLDTAALGAAGASVGYPLLVKASAGGGGKGMRVVAGPDELVEAVEGARREAVSAFGDGTVFLERYLLGARHVEVQVFGDTHGNVVHLFERECSIQRRHQKVVEEAPSPGVTDATRDGLYTAAVAAAKAIGYVGAGTVEFLVLGSGEEQEFFFLEMNTRLQVEHPVTEEITGVDLVRWQLLVAQGGPIPLRQKNIRRRGHAVEVRLYAEDPARGYLPNTGVLERCAFDPSLVRVDTGVESGSEISAYYDPMIAKVIAHGADRDEAARRLALGLSGARLHGLTTNRDSLVAVLEHPAFLRGDTTTSFLEQHPEVLAPRAPVEVVDVHLLAAAAAGRARAGAIAAGSPAGANSAVPQGFRNVVSVGETRRFADNSGTESALHYDVDRDGRWRWGVDRGDGTAWRDERATVDVGPHPDPASVAVSVDDGTLHRRLVVTTYPGSPTDDGTGEARVAVDDGTWSTSWRALPRFRDTSQEASAHGPSTPVPGTVTLVSVSVGDRVTEGQTLVVLEAMKMEHRITADADSVVAEVLVEVGQSVDAHQVVVVLADDEGEPS